MSPPSISPSDTEYITRILDEFSRLMLAAATRCGPPGEAKDILSDASRRVQTVAKVLDDSGVTLEKVTLYSLARQY